MTANRNDLGCSSSVFLLSSFLPSPLPLLQKTFPAIFHDRRNILFPSSSYAASTTAACSARSSSLKTSCFLPISYLLYCRRIAPFPLDFLHPHGAMGCRWQFWICHMLVDVGNNKLFKIVTVI